MKSYLRILLSAALLMAIFGLTPHRSLAQKTGGSLPPPPPPPPPVTTGVLTITLPAKEIITPDQLRIGNPGNIGTYTYTFNAGTGQFALTQGTNSPYIVTTTTHYDSSGLDNNGRSLGYTIRVEGFVKGGGQLALNSQKGGSLLARLEEKLQGSLGAKAFAPPFPCFAVCAKIAFPYRLTFKSGTGTTTLPKSTVASYQSYITTFPHSNELADTFICNGDGTLNSSGTNLCIKEKTTFETPERGVTGPLYTLQAIPLGVTGAINIQGNAAAAGTIAGFNFNALSSAIAVGGSIPDAIPNANKTLQNYINQNATKFSWTNVKPQLDALFAKRAKGTAPGGSQFIGSTTYTGSTWNLNSSTNDPSNAGVSSFSSPPEGKLWNIPGSFFRLPNNIQFSGSGTIAVNGPIEIDGNITCAPGTRLGIVATGTINFIGSTINCGAYTTLGSNSDIVFNYQVGANGLTARGIFVAGHSIHLPSLGAGISYSINYDDTFGSNPTVLYSELLKIVFSSSN